MASKFDSRRGAQKLSGGDVIYALSPSGDVTAETATVVSTTAKFSGGEARKRNYIPVYGSHDKRSTTQGCTQVQSAQIAQATPAAQRYITNTLSYTGTVTGPRSRYTWWFGAYSPGHRAMVMDHFSRVVNDPNDIIIAYDCSTCPGTQYRNAFAFVRPNDPYKIYLCAAFWRAPVTGTDSRAGTTVHELSHFTNNGGTRDWAYGQSAAHSLALSNPSYLSYSPPPDARALLNFLLNSRAVTNADSHEYYAENTPIRS